MIYVTTRIISKLYGGIFLPSLSNYDDLSDLYVDLIDIMSTCQIILLLWIFIAFTTQENILKIYFLTND